jgi:2-polyprenyl-3-methyl-5-hydroxy-6-metoxy-1,4-benzoquinol methylase
MLHGLWLEQRRGFKYLDRLNAETRAKCKHRLPLSEDVKCSLIISQLSAFAILFNEMTYIKDQSRGNYRHYYTRRRATDQYPLPLDQDERIHVLDPSLFRGKVVLDVGCNSGEVAVELGKEIAL